MPSPIIEARRSLLSILPRILASLAVLWKAINVSDQRKKFTGKDQACWALGTPKVSETYSNHFNICLHLVAFDYTDFYFENINDDVTNHVIP